MLKLKLDEVINMNNLDKIVKFAKSTGFIFQGSEIYGGLSNTWDYGPLGSLLKQNIKNAWLKRFQKEHPENFLLDSSILLNNKVWEASGHISGFSDPLTECKKCNLRFRADNLIKNNNSKVNPDGWDHQKMYEYILSNKIECPNCNESRFLPIKSFNMMFETFQGVVKENANQIYLRPETAQGIFINFRNIIRTTRARLPFGVCQIGKAFRNEITPGNFIFRTREFEQMELEYFVKPGSEIKWFEYWKKQCKDFLTDLGINEKNIKFDDHKKESLAHYSNATTDILYNFSWGFEELWGIASRTDFDLDSHEKVSKQSMLYTDPITNDRFKPYVIEPSVGVERLLLAFLNDSLEEEILESGENRTVLKIHPVLAPYKIAVLPLIKKNHKEMAQKIFKDLINYYDVTYDESQNIGKRYRRQDQIGTYFCATIDDQTLIDNTVTIRNRDTMKQERIKIEEIKNYIKEVCDF